MQTRTAVYGLIKNTLDEFLIVRRSPHDTMPGTWEMPGGSLEDGESLSQGVCREVEEETGLSVSVRGQLTQVVEEYGNTKTRRIAFLCHYHEGPVTLSGEHDAYGWITKERLKGSNRPLSNFLEKTLLVVEELEPQL